MLAKIAASPAIPAPHLVGFEPCYRPGLSGGLSLTSPLARFPEPPDGT